LTRKPAIVQGDGDVAGRANVVSLLSYLFVPAVVVGLLLWSLPTLQSWVEKVFGESESDPKPVTKLSPQKGPSHSPSLLFEILPALPDRAIRAFSARCARRAYPLTTSLKDKDRPIDPSDSGPLGPIWDHDLPAWFHDFPAAAWVTTCPDASRATTTN
jgi:hypothetical protein